MIRYTAVSEVEQVFADCSPLTPGLFYETQMVLIAMYLKDGCFVKKGAGMARAFPF
jgi:hypothetical protein